MLIFSLFFQGEANYENIPRYDLTKEFIRDKCQRVLYYYDRTPYTKMIRVFFEILFDTYQIIYIMFCFWNRQDIRSRWPGLDIRKRQAIHAITRMAGFYKTFSQFNGAMNNVLNTIRKKKYLRLPTMGNTRPGFFVIMMTKKWQPRNVRIDIMNHIKWFAFKKIRVKSYF